MAGKGHCNFDTSEEDSEFAEFYDFSDGPEDDVRSETEDDGEETNQEEAAASSARTPQAAGQDSIRLPSGRIISRQSPASTGPSSTQLRRRVRTYASRLARTMIEDDGQKEEEKGASQEEEPGPGASDTRLMSRRERRERETITYQMESMSASDRNSLVHLPPSQQRAILAAQFRHAVKVQKEERRRQGRVDRKGNKNLYAYWHTETPVYQCG